MYSRLCKTEKSALNAEKEKKESEGTEGEERNAASSFGASAFTSAPSAPGQGLGSLAQGLRTYKKRCGDRLVKLAVFIYR